MKKLLLLILGFTFWINVSFAYETQGFTNYNETNGSITFSCEKQCFIVLWKKGASDTIRLEWDILWSGSLWYWFLNEQQIIPWEFQEIPMSWKLSKSYIFNSLSYYSQLPKDIPVILIIEGTAESKNLSVRLKKKGFSEKINYLWESFWKVETLTPYSINLRYWVKIWDDSIVKIGYILFIIFGTILFLQKKYRHSQYFLILWVSIILFIAYRNLYTYSQILDNGFQNYSFQEYEKKKYFDLGDYTVFTDKVRKTLNLDGKWEGKNCSLYIQSFQDWPFITHWKTVYLKPCTFIDKEADADYAIYYKVPIKTQNQYETLIEYNGSFLLKILKK